MSKFDFLSLHRMLMEVMDAPRPSSSYCDYLPDASHYFSHPVQVRSSYEVFHIEAEVMEAGAEW